MSGFSSSSTSDHTQGFARSVGQATPRSFDERSSSPHLFRTESSSDEIGLWSEGGIAQLCPAMFVAPPNEGISWGPDVSRLSSDDGSLLKTDSSTQSRADGIHQAMGFLQQHYALNPGILVKGDRMAGSMVMHDVVTWSTLDDSSTASTLLMNDLGSRNMIDSRPTNEPRADGGVPGSLTLPVLSVEGLLLQGHPKLGTPAAQPRYTTFDARAPYIKNDDFDEAGQAFLLQVIFYTSACFLLEIGQAPEALMIAQKGEAMRMLKELLQASFGHASEGTIIGVLQLIINEWYWGEMGDLRAHLTGLTEMIWLRGGVSQLGMGGLLARHALS